MTTTRKPYAALIGANGNIFNLTGIASVALKRAGLWEESKEMAARVMASGSYDEALMILCEYVDTTPPDDDGEDE